MTTGQTVAAGSTANGKKFGIPAGMNRALHKVELPTTLQGSKRGIV